MSLGRTIAKHSTVYYVGSLIDQSLQFLLLPIYTRFLSDTEMGVLAVAQGIGAVLILVIGFGLPSAAARLYFEYRDDPTALREFWGTLFISLAVFAVIVGSILLAWGGQLLQPFIADVAFYPFILLAVVHAMLTPLITAYLLTLQTRQIPLRYVLLNTGRLALTITLIVVFVVGYQMDARGPLLAYALAAGVYWLAVAALLTREVTLCFRWHYLRHALGYAIPLVPTAIAGRAGYVADRLIITNLLGKAAAGIYNAGFLVGSAIEALAMAVNFAFMPIFRDAMKTRDHEKFEQLRRISLLIVFGYSLAGLTVGLFAWELFHGVMGERFYASYAIVPLIAAAAAVKGVYFLFANVLQYFRTTLWYGAAIACGMLPVTIGLNFWLIPVFGVQGAGAAAIATQCGMVILVAWAGHRRSAVNWDYLRYAGLLVVGLGPSLALGPISWSPWWLGTLIKSGVLLLAIPALSLTAWNHPLMIVQLAASEVRRLRASRPSES